MKPRIWLSPPHMSGFEQKYIDQAFETNWISHTGPNIQGFENELIQYTGSPHIAALGTGTAAIHLALILSDVRPGDLVICQSFTFSATANPIVYLGAKPVFIDSEPDTWNMNPQLVEDAIKACRLGFVSGIPQTPKAIIAVHLYGMPAKIGEIIEIAAKYNIPVIEDAAEALGSEVDGRKCGTFGKMGVLSFNGNKIITTGGGGALLSQDAGLIAKARFLATQARDKAPHYQHSQIGYNYSMSNIVAGVGRGQLKVIDERVAARRANFERYRQYFASIVSKGYNVEFQGERLSAVSSQLSVSFSNRWLTAILIDPVRNKGITREKLRLAFEAENIESRPLWKPMHLQPVFEGCAFFSSQQSAFSSQHSAISKQQSAVSSQLSAFSYQRSALSNQYQGVRQAPSAERQAQTSVFRQAPSAERHPQTSVSEMLFENGLCLPSGSNLTNDEWGRIFSVLDGVFE